jgi:hypothetical protein
MAYNNLINNIPDNNRTVNSVAIYSTGGTLSEVGPLTNGQLLIGSTGNNPSAASFTSSDGTMTIGNSAGAITLGATYQEMGRSMFHAYLSAPVFNATGDGTTYTIVFNTTLFNVGSNFSTGFGIYTAPATGKYFMGATVSLGGTGVLQNEEIVAIESTNHTYYITIFDGGNSGGSLSQTGQNSGVITDLDSGDNVYVTVTVTGGTKTNGVQAFDDTIFFGYRVA